MLKNTGRYSSGQREQTVNLLRLRFGGSNPSLPTSFLSNIPLQRKKTGVPSHHRKVSVARDQE